MAAFEVKNHYDKREYGAAAGVLYRTFVNVAVRWAALVHALQMVLQALHPSLKDNRVLDAIFMCIKHVNPAVAGQIGVDAVVTTAQGIVQLVATGKMDLRTYQALARRMQNSPLQVYTKMGDSIGEWLGDKFGEWFYKTFLR